MEAKNLEEKIREISKEFLNESADEEIFIISHLDTDGITSAAIMIKTLQKLDRKFSVKILKNLEEDFINELPKDKIILFLDLASGSLEKIEKANLKKVYIIDHHEIAQNVPEKIKILNPELHDKQKISGSGMTYLFCREINPEIKNSAKLAILGMIGDSMEKDIDKLNNGILDDGEIKRKRGVLIYPSTRPLNRTLEYCSRPFIPGVSGNLKGVLELLREIGLSPKNGKYKSIMDLTEEEMEKLATSIVLRNPKAKSSELLGDIFLIKLFSKLEDAREISAVVNACSRLGYPDIALQFCMEIPKSKKQAETIYAKYKQIIISGIKFAMEAEKIEGSGFAIINAQDKIRDTVVGTIASIISYSGIYEEGTAIIASAYSENKIKISARIAGKNHRNIREVLSNVVGKIGGEVGGHERAAGAVIEREKEKEFLDLLRKNLEIEVVKV